MSDSKPLSKWNVMKHEHKMLLINGEDFVVVSKLSKIKAERLLANLASELLENKLVESKL